MKKRLMNSKNRQEQHDPMDPYNSTEKSTWAFGRREKVLITATLILFIVLSVKSIYFDAYKPVGTNDMSEIEAYIGEQYDGFLYDNGLLKVRIIEFKTTDEETTVQLHLRKYFLGVFPIGDVYTGF